MVKRHLLAVDKRVVMTLLVMLNIIAMGWLFSFTTSIAIGTSSGGTTFLNSDSIETVLKTCLVTIGMMLVTTFILGSWYLNIKKEEDKFKR